ncbi:hypothetical protein D0441_30815 [Priestia megaterium]|nr:hypothetical protein D0441_30815 [Priestia megaterium]
MNEENFLSGNLPLSIDILFNNNVLDLATILSVLFANRKKSKGITIDELTYYAGISTSVYYEKIVEALLNSEVVGEEIISNYFHYEKKIRYLALELSYFRYITLEEDKEKDAYSYNLNVKISKDGEAFIKNLESKYIKDIIEKSNYLKTKVKFNNTRMCLLQGGFK